MADRADRDEDAVGRRCPWVVGRVVLVSLATAAVVGAVRGVRFAAGYVLDALSAAGGMRSEVAMRRIVTVILAGFRRPGGAGWRRWVQLG